jgi:BirA family biotin operon repressor/biotin-[acetyl-CoA-carboxylase] ligase
MLKWNLTTKDSVNSTNDYLKELGKSGAPEGTAILAQWQIAGHGRLGRYWVSPHGLGLYLSWLVRPPKDFISYELMGVLTGVPVAQLLRARFGLDVCLKWSNDIMVGGRKLGGILGETIVNGSKRFLVLGLGLNLRHREWDFPSDLRDTATSLAIEGVNDCCTEELAQAMLDAFTPFYADCINGKWQPWRDLYKDVSCTLGTRQQRGSEEGIAVGLGDHGELLVQRLDGKIVSWEL